VKTYSIAEVVDMFGGGSDWWLRHGMQTGRFGFLQVGRERRFTDTHVEAIAAELEQRATPKQTSPGADVSSLGATQRSATRHRNRAAS
jgi:hypothetical protein